MDDIVKLKTRIRRLEWLAGLLLVGCGTVALTSSRSESIKTVRAERFEMVDSQSRVRGYWRITDDGASAFTLYDAEGRSRVALYELPAGASEVVVTNSSGRTQRLSIEGDTRSTDPTKK